MAKNDTDNAPINTIIGPGSSIFGDVETAGFLRVDGRIRGTVKASGRVVVGEQARLESDIHGTVVVVGGVVKGDIVASERVTILASGIVIGDIVTKRISVEDGVVLRGRVVACGEEAFETQAQRHRDARSVAAASGSGAAFFGSSDG